MKQSSNKTIQHVVWGGVFAVAVGAYLLVVPGISFAAKAAPVSGVGGLPYQAPLQPLPQGVGANVSNNIQQAENFGPPDSASTVLPGPGGLEDGDISDAPVRRGATPIKSDGVVSTRGRIVSWLFVGVVLAGALVWIWFTIRRRAVK